MLGLSEGRHVPNILFEIMSLIFMDLNVKIGFEDPVKF